MKHLIVRWWLTGGLSTIVFLIYEIKQLTLWQSTYASATDVVVFMEKYQPQQSVTQESTNTPELLLFIWSSIHVLLSVR